MAILAVACVTNACKDPDEIGADVLPSADQLQLILSDSNTVISQTVAEDSVRGDELSLSLLGSYDDPVFGISTASVYSQVYLSGTPNFGGVTVADSLVLILNYSSLYGDTVNNSSQTVNVYRMDQDMYVDSSYFTFQNFTTQPSSIGNLTFTPTMKSSVVGTDTLAPQIRIKLSQALADSLILLDGQTEFASNANWISYFKGIQIKPDEVNVPGNGVISSFSFTSSKLSLYYHDTSNTVKTYNFSLSGARVNHFDHNYGSSPVGLQLADPLNGDTLSYLQAMSGVKTKITFPYLKNYLDSGKIAINKTELKVTIRLEPGSYYTPPLNVFLLALDSLGHVYFPADYSESNSGYGGTLGSDGATYTFNIARQIQHVLNGTIKDYGYYLVVAGSSVQAKRVVLGSGKNATNPIRLRLYYTKLH